MKITINIKIEDEICNKVLEVSRQSHSVLPSDSAGDDLEKSALQLAEAAFRSAYIKFSSERELREYEHAGI